MIFARWEKGKTMSDYIKREDALEQFDYYDLGEYLTTQIRGMLMDIPSADVAPVRHGRWEKRDDLFLDTLYRCSVCGEEFYLENGTPQENQYYYCPNCGAKMDEEETKE